MRNIAGTVVKRKRGKFLADLAHPGDEILVARGGQGGVGIECDIYQSIQNHSFFFFVIIMRISIKFCLYVS